MMDRADGWIFTTRYLRILRNLLVVEKKKKLRERRASAFQVAGRQKMQENKKHAEIHIQVLLVKRLIFFFLYFFFISNNFFQAPGFLEICFMYSLVPPAFHFFFFFFYFVIFGFEDFFSYNFLSCELNLGFLTKLIFSFFFL